MRILADFEPKWHEERNLVSWKHQNSFHLYSKIFDKLLEGYIY